MARDRVDADLARGLPEPRPSNRALRRPHRLRRSGRRLASGLCGLQTRGDHPADLHPLRPWTDPGPALPPLLPAGAPPPPEGPAHSPPIEETPPPTDPTHGDRF